MRLTSNVLKEALKWNTERLIARKGVFLRQEGIDETLARPASPWLPWKTTPSRERPPWHLEWRTAGRACGDARCRPSAAPQVRGPQTSGGRGGLVRLGQGRHYMCW